MKYYVGLLGLGVSLFLSCNQKADTQKKNKEIYENRFEGSRYNIQEHDTMLLDKTNPKESLMDSQNNNLNNNY